MKIKDLINKLKDYDEELDLKFEIEVDEGEYQNLSMVDSKELAISGNEIYIELESVKDNDDQLDDCDDEHSMQ